MAAVRLFRFFTLAWGRGVRAAVGLTVIATLVGLAEASAQDRNWFGRPYGARDARMPSDINERDAAVMYAESRADLDAARFSMAQRRLELLVSKYPLSALAEVARRDLQKLYSMNGAGGAASERADEPSTGRVRLPSEPLRGDSRVESRTDGYRPAGLPASTGASTPERSRPSAPPLQPSSALRLANEDFRQQAGDRIFFADGSADLGARARSALEAQAQWLARHPDVRVRVEGHADDQGSREFNREMAEQRADVVRLRLNDLGVPADRIEIAAHGRNAPLADCSEQACKTQNRRVVTVIVHVPSSLGFDAPARRTLGNAASVVGQPSRAP